MPVPPVAQSWIIGRPGWRRPAVDGAGVVAGPGWWPGRRDAGVAGRRTGIPLAAMTDPAALPIFGLSGPEPADTATGEPVPLRDRAFDALIEAGYDAEVDEDGDLAVTIQGQRLFVRCVDSLPPLMRVFGQWLVDDLPADELVRLRAANAVTATVNLAKATIHDDRLVVAVDLLAGDEFHLPSLLQASVDAVLGCVRTWYGTALELSERM